MPSYSEEKSMNIGSDLITAVTPTYVYRFGRGGKVNSISVLTGVAAAAGGALTLTISRRLSPGGALVTPPIRSVTNAEMLAGCTAAGDVLIVDCRTLGNTDFNPGEELVVALVAGTGTATLSICANLYESPTGAPAGSGVGAENKASFLPAGTGSIRRI